MDYHSGNVNFPGGLANATSTYFSLENVLCAANFSFPASFNVTKTTTSTGVTAGSNTPIAYTLTAQNLGGVSGNVTVSDAAPAGTTYVAGSATCPGVSAPETCGVTNNSGTLTWTLTNVAGGTSAALTFSVTVPIGYGSTTVGNTASWSGPGCATATCWTNALTTPITPASFTLTYNAETGGSVVGSTSQTVDFGLNGTTVTAVASPGYYFTGWSDAEANAGRTDDDIVANLSVTANFAPLTSSVSTWVWANGGAVTGNLLAGVVGFGYGLHFGQSEFDAERHREFHPLRRRLLQSGNRRRPRWHRNLRLTDDQPRQWRATPSPATSLHSAPAATTSSPPTAATETTPPRTGPCEPFWVCPAPVSWTSTTVNANGSPIGTAPIKTKDSITDTASVTGNEETTATGMVTFTLYSGGWCTQGTGSGGTQVGSPYTTALDGSGDATSSAFKWLAPGTLLLRRQLSR